MSANFYQTDSTVLSTVSGTGFANSYPYRMCFTVPDCALSGFIGRIDSFFKKDCYEVFAFHDGEMYKVHGGFDHKMFTVYIFFNGESGNHSTHLLFTLLPEHFKGVKKVTENLLTRYECHEREVVELQGLKDKVLP